MSPSRYVPLCLHPRSPSASSCCSRFSFISQTQRPGLAPVRRAQHAVARPSRQVLRVSAAAFEGTVRPYTLRKGDTLASIAKKRGGVVLQAPAGCRQGQQGADRQDLRASCRAHAMLCLAMRKARPPKLEPSTWSNLVSCAATANVLWSSCRPDCGPADQHQPRC